MEKFERARAARRIGVALVAAACGLGAGVASAVDCPPGQDQDCDVDLTASVVANPVSVTRSTAALPTLMSYQVTLTHYASPENLTAIGFSLTTAVLDSSNQPVAGQVATFQTVPANCTPAGGTTLNCTNLGALTDANQQTSPFVVTVQAPTAGDHVLLSVTSVSYSDDNGPLQTIASTATAVTALTAPNPDSVNTFVPPAGGTFYTGTNGGLPVPGSADTAWVAVVTVPNSSAPNYTGTVGSIANTFDDQTCARAANLLNCSISTITLPGTFPNLLTIVLRRDGSTVIGNQKIGSAIVYYSPTDDPGAPGINYPIQVPACTDTTYGQLPKAGIPCIQSRNAYFLYNNGQLKKGQDNGNGSSTGNGSGKLSFWEFFILALDNGRYTN
jgi:hypothetical protein